MACVVVRSKHFSSNHTWLKSAPLLITVPSSIHFVVEPRVHSTLLAVDVRALLCLFQWNVLPLSSSWSRRSITASNQRKFHRNAISKGPFLIHESLEVWHPFIPSPYVSFKFERTVGSPSNLLNHWASFSSSLPTPPPPNRSA